MSNTEPRRLRIVERLAQKMYEASEPGNILWLRRGWIVRKTWLKKAQERLRVPATQSIGLMPGGMSGEDQNIAFVEYLQRATGRGGLESDQRRRRAYRYGEVPRRSSYTNLWPSPVAPLKLSYFLHLPIWARTLPLKGLLKRQIDSTSV